MFGIFGMLRIFNKREVFEICGKFSIFVLCVCVPRIVVFCVLFSCNEPSITAAGTS